MAHAYVQLLNKLMREYNISNDLYSSLSDYSSIKASSAEQNLYSKPMPWIGMYITLASMVCNLAMAADLIHGLRNRKLWFPCKYFTMNAAHLTVIAVAMKIPVDLNNSMTGNVDQMAKIGSMAFMCTMMANLLPSLSTMDNKELVTNTIALGVFIITLFVNVCIEIKTGVINEVYYYGDKPFYRGLIAITSAAMLLVLLIIHISTALTILKSKQILELKFLARHETALKDQEMQQPQLTVEKLKKQVRDYWIMAETSSPHFMIVCSATTNASGVICAVSTTLYAIYAFVMYGKIRHHGLVLGSDYKWSMLWILITQFVGAILGTIAPLTRCFAALSFKFSIKWIWNHIQVFKVEGYWTQKLRDWKQSSIPFSISSRKSKILFQYTKILSLNVCIGFQKTVVVACKMIGLIPIFLVICVLLFISCSKWLKHMFRDPFVVNRPGQQDTNIELSYYSLQHQDDMELTERTLKKISDSVNWLIKRAEKHKPYNLMNLLAESRGFEGVGKYDSHKVPTLLSEEYLDCWSLSLITLSTIAISLPNIQNNRVDKLLRSVSEGLVYVTLVEESLNTDDKYASIQKAAKMLWVEVEVYHYWLGNKLKNPDNRLNTAGQILQWLKVTAKNMIPKVRSTDNGSPNDDSKINMSICANSMYRITETILLSYNTNIEEVSQDKLFRKLSTMIADILAACLTNLPQVIAMKCHESVIEKREASVHAAAQVLGETTHIINSLQDRELPSLNPDELPFIDKWRYYLIHPSP